MVGAGRRARLEPVLPSVAEARRLVSDTLAGRRVEAGTTSDAILVVSELVTNAVLHARTPLEVGVLVEGPAVRIEVRDGSDRPVVSPGVVPAPPVSSIGVFDEPGVADDLDSLIEALATTGRGMELVTKLASRWGVTAHVVGKTVWAEVGSGATGMAARAAMAPPAPLPVAEATTTALVALPVRLVAESDRNFDDTMRELQYIGMAGTAEAVVLDLARMATDVFDRLGSFRLSGQVAVRGALERGDRLVDLHLPMPDDIHDRIAGLDDLLTAVAAARTAGRLLILGPSPEVVDFRLWYRDEVRRQLAGRRPRPCPFPAAPTVAEPGPVGLGLNQRRRHLLDGLEAELAEASDARQVAAAAVRRVAADTGASFVSLMLVEDDHQHVSLADRVGYPEGEPLGRRYPVSDDNPLSEVLRTAVPLVLRTPQERFERFPHLVMSSTVQRSPTGVWVPLGERAPAAGALVVGFSQARDFTGTDLNFLLEVARAVRGRLRQV